MIRLLANTDGPLHCHPVVFRELRAACVCQNTRKHAGSTAASVSQLDGHRGARQTRNSKLQACRSRSQLTGVWRSCSPPGAPCRKCHISTSPVLACSRPLGAKLLRITCPSGKVVKFEAGKVPFHQAPPSLPTALPAVHGNLGSVAAWLATSRCRV
jgi:hypothetical protein